MVECKDFGGLETIWKKLFFSVYLSHYIPMKVVMGSNASNKVRHFSPEDKTCLVINEHLRRV